MFFKRKDHKYAIVKKYDAISCKDYLDIFEYDKTELDSLNIVNFYFDGKQVISVYYPYVLGVNYTTIGSAERAREKMIEESSGCSCHCECECEDEDVTMYVVTGEYPNLAISPKYVEAEDEFNFCFSEMETDNLSLHPKDRCFDTYEQANNKVIELIQKATSTKKK